MLLLILFWLFVDFLLISEVLSYKILRLFEMPALKYDAKLK